MSGLTRRKAIGVAGVSLAGAALGTGVARGDAIEPLQDWRMHQFDRGHTGYNPEASGVKSSPSRLWEFDTGASITANAGPMLVDQRLYVPNEDGIVRGLRVDDGREFWHFDMEATSVMTTPALGADEGLVFVGGESAPLYAIGNRSGEVEWTREFRNGHFVGSPTYADGTLYVARHELFALDAATGETRWRAPDVEGVEGCVAIADGVVYAFGTEGRVDAVAAGDGEPIWSRSLDTRLHADYFETTAADGRVYVGGRDQSLYALSADDGETLWRFRPETNFDDRYHEAQSSPAVYEDTVIFGHHDGRVYALDAVDGAVRWTFETGDRVFCSPAVADGVVYVGGLDGRFYALSAEDGGALWSYDVGAGVWSSCIVTGNGVIFPTTNGHVVALGGSGSASDSDGGTGGSVRTPPDDGSDSRDVPDAEGPPPQRGFFSNSGDGPDALENVFNLTVLGFMLSIAGIVHQLVRGR